MDAMQARRVLRSMLMWCVLCAGLSMTTLAQAGPALIWSLEEHQPDIKQGGRANTIALHPLNNDRMIVASESGGLFRSEDRGVTWSHIESFKPYVTGSVAFLPSNPDIVIATSAADFTSANTGGIWRSTNGGGSWTQMAIPATPTGATARFGAGEISIAPDSGRIYVATSWGLSFSDDNGANWSTLSPFGSGAVVSVLALSGNRVFAAHRWLGVMRSPDGGATWLTPATGAGGIADMHAFARSPVASSTAYVVNAATQLFVTNDSGDHWTQIASAPAGGGGCGGIAFVKAIGRKLLAQTALRLYFGNRCGLYSQTPVAIAGTGTYDYSGAWTASTLDHSDTRDLVFTRNIKTLLGKPLLLATDGGLHRTADGGATWTFTGGGAAGYNALQMTEAKGQRIDDIDRYDLYFGTQDNNSWYSPDEGASWPGTVCCEGFFFEMAKHVSTTSDAQVSFVSCGACVDLFAGAGLAGLTNWPDPPGARVGNPAFVGKSFHVEGVADDSGFPRGFAVSTDLGAHWKSYAAFSEDRRDMPKLTRRNLLHFPRASQVQTIRTGWDAANGFERDTLMVVTRSLTGTGASVHYPAMNGFGGLGINPTMFAWYEVFGVDPLDGRYLIAPDVINHKMMQSSDGGENWSEMPALTALVTGNGRFDFNESIFPHASAVSYNRESPEIVAVGTHQNGLMLSFDHGATWSKLGGSERATYITSVEWSSRTDAYVTTYGRGLWRLHGQLWIPRVEPLCAIIGCVIRLIDKGDPPPFDFGIAIFDGEIRGVRTEHGVLREVFVSPGSTVGFVGTPGHAPAVKITQTMKSSGLQGDLASVPRARAWMAEGARAIALDRKGRVIGMATSKTRLPFEAALDAKPRRAMDSEPRENARSPIADAPYLEVRSRTGRFDRLQPGEPIQIRTQRIDSRRDIEILIDDRRVDAARANDNDGLRFELRAPTDLGLHRLVLRDARSGKVIDGTMLMVRPMDDRDAQRKPPHDAR